MFGGLLYCYLNKGILSLKDVGRSALDLRQGAGEILLAFLRP
jgi:hypothetical protein